MFAGAMMAFYSEPQFRSFQGRMKPVETRGLRLPAMTIFLGVVSAVAITAGALNWLPTGDAGTGEMSNMDLFSIWLPHD